MSSFAPGFAGRIAAAENMLHRAFGDSEAFAPVAIGNIGRRSAQEAAPAPRHFEPADRTTNPTQGWDPFAPEAPAGHGPFVDPIAQAHAAGFEEGHAAALAEVAAARAREAALLDQVSAALSSGAHFDRERMAGHLRQTVLHLVSRMVGETGISGDLLAARIGAAVDLLSDSAESALLRMHPDDVPLVQGKLPTSIFPVGDPHLAPGHFVIESASTIVEDGPAMWMEQLAQAIDRVPIPPQC